MATPKCDQIDSDRVSELEPNLGGQIEPPRGALGVRIEPSARTCLSRFFCFGTLWLHIYKERGIELEIRMRSCFGGVLFRRCLFLGQALIGTYLFLGQVLPTEPAPETGRS